MGCPTRPDGLPYRSAVGVNQDGVAILLDCPGVDATAGERWCERLPAVDVAVGVHHDGWCAPWPRLDRPVVLVGVADGCNQDGAEMLDTGRCTELDTGRCTAA